MTNEEICNRIQNGEIALFDDLLEKNRRFIHWMVYKYHRIIRDRYIGVDEEDLEQCVKMALFRAVGAFDPDRGKTFICFATWLAKREIYSLIGLRNGVSNRPELNAVTVSKDEPLVPQDDESDARREDLIEDLNALKPEEVTIRHLIDERVREIVDELPESEAEVIRLHQLKQLPLKIAAGEMEISEKQARQIYRRGISRLFRNQKLKQLLDEYEPLAYRHKGLAAFRTSRTSVVEDAVIKLEQLRGRGKANR